MNNNVFGQTVSEALGNNIRYLYGLRRTDEGDLYFVSVDQLSRADSIQLDLSSISGNYDETGIMGGSDFMTGRDATHNLINQNITWEQLRWDDRRIYYYMDANGEFVARVNQKYNYNSEDNKP
jgi:hypothetical protein